MVSSNSIHQRRLNQYKRSIFAFCVLLLGAACFEYKGLEELQRNQALILDRLEQIEKKLQRSEEAIAYPSVTKDEKAEFYAISIQSAPQQPITPAWVTIVEFSDFQCPFCQKSEEILHKLQKEYSTHDVKWVFRHYPMPFHTQAKLAAFSSMCAEQQGQFWPMHHKLFANSDALEHHHLRHYAQEIGLNMQQYETCMNDSNKLSRKLQNDLLLAEELGIIGVPAYVINGHFLSGAQPLSVFKQKINEALVKAKSSGISRELYYNEAVLKKAKSFSLLEYRK
jgi:protein-disulfide isomerase